MEIVYSIITYFYIVFGLVCGSYILWRAFANHKDSVLFFNMLILGMAQVSMGIIYADIAMQGVTPLYQVSSLSYFLRPTVSFILLMPALIIRRVRL